MDSIQTNLAVTKEDLEIAITKKETINVNEILNKITEEIKTPISLLGEALYKIAVVLTNYLDNFEDNSGEKEIIYKHVSDLTGLSRKTLKNLVWLHRKLKKYDSWDSQSNVFKLKMFLVSYYIVRATTEAEKVVQEVYESACIMKDWFENAKITEIKSWIKSVHYQYFRTFPAIREVHCAICDKELREEERGDKWDFYPVCRICWDNVIKESWVKNGEQLALDKIAMIRNKIAKIFREEKIASLIKENEELKQKCLELIEIVKNLREKEFAKKMLKKGKLEVGGNG